MLIPYYLSIGLIASFLSGLLGIGGGLVILPTLLFLWQHHPVVPSIELTPTVIVTSMCISMITLCQTAWIHYRCGQIRWRICQLLAPGLIIGSMFIGPTLVHTLPTHLLHGLFGIFSLATACQLIFSQHYTEQELTLPSPLFWRSASIVIGSLCALLGISGSTLIGPLLSYYRIPIRAIIATCAFLGFIITISSTTGFLLLSWLKHSQDGLMYWPAVLWISLPSLIGSRIGVYCAHQLPIGCLRRIFALLLSFVAVKMLASL